MLKGIDISHYQMFNDYRSFNESGLAFVYIKATEGIYKDRDFEIHSKGFEKTNLLKGAYHFLRFKSSAEEQANNFIETALPLHGKYDLPPVLDIEDARGSMSLEECQKIILNWLNKVQNAFHVKPIIYTGGWFWRDPAHMANTSFLNNYSLWTSQYNKKDYLPLYGGWQTPLFWQYDDKGTINGLIGNSIDLDYFIGDTNALWSLTGQTSLIPSDQYNPKVEAVQYILNKKNISTGKQDGIFTTYTLTAFHEWLDKNKLPQEDKITPKHWQLLFDLENINDKITTSVTAHLTTQLATAITPKPGIVSVNKLNIRSGADIKSPMIAMPLDKGQQVQILEEKNGWYKVKTEIEGWVNKSYIS